MDKEMILVAVEPVDLKMREATTGGAQPNSSLSSRRALLFGMATGAASTVIFQPLDLLKTRVQNRALDQKTAGLLEMCRQVHAEGGVRRFWRGTVPSLVRMAPGVGIYFGCLQFFQNVLPLNPTSGVQNYLLGFSVRVITSAVMLPATVIKTRFESAAYEYRSMFDAVRDIIRKEKIRGLYSGCLATILRDAPYSGIYLAFYRLHLSLVPKDLFSACSALVFFVCAASSSFLACLMTQPLDMVKTQMQLLPMQNRTFLLTVLNIVKTTGVTSLFDGLGARLLRKCLMTAMNWTIFEEVALFHDKKKRKTDR